VSPTGKNCAACTHDRRSELDAALSRGEPYRELWRELDLCIGALTRHRKAHLDNDRAGGAAAPAQDDIFECVRGEVAR